MTRNYFILTKNGLGLEGTKYPPFARGTGPAVTSVTDKRLNPDGLTCTNLIKNPSLETNTTGWTAGAGSTIARVTRASVGSTYDIGIGTYLLKVTLTASGTPIAYTEKVGIAAGVSYTAIVRLGPPGVPRSAALEFLDAAGTLLASTTGDALGFAPGTSITATAPAGATQARIRCMPGSGSVSDFGTVDAVWLGTTQDVEDGPGGYWDGATTDTPDWAYSWTGAAHASTSVAVTAVYNIDSPITGVPADLAAMFPAQLGSDGLRGTHDVPAGVTPDFTTDAAYGQSMLWPTAFYRSVFRAVRDPAITSDDSTDTLANQVYNHGWVIAERLVAYFIDTRKGANPAYSSLTWPPQESLAVVPVTGTPDVSGTAGWYGFRSVTWPGPAVGTGTLRQILAGDESATKQVAVILDRLAATTTAQRTAIGNAYTAAGGAIATAVGNMDVAAGTALTVQSPIQKRYQGRVNLNGFMARAAVGLDMWNESALGSAVLFALCAVTAKEAGVIGGTFTNAHYDTLTAPIEAGIAMPSGY